MPKLSDANYKVFEQYVETVLTRAGVSRERQTDAKEDLMHPLTALLDGGEGSLEFIPYIKMMLAKWDGDNANRT